MKSIEVKAKTVHEAISDACEKLGVSQDQITVEVLSQGGMFGKAKVLVTVKEEEKKETAEQKQETKTEIKNESKAEQKKEHAPEPKKEVKKTEVKQDGPTDPNSPKFTKTLAFVKTLLELLENDSAVTTELTEKSFNININGDNVGRLIGKGGEVLNAIQTLVSGIAISNANGEGKRVFVNIGDYKERRGDSLQSLAMKKAEYVKNTGRFIKLDPMNARDRAIVHTTLGNVEGIRTYSTGKDPFRCLCIAPADKNEKKEA